MSRIATLFAIAAFLVIAAPAEAAPPPGADTNLATLSVLENELYAEARVTRDLIAAQHDNGALGTAPGQATMEQLQAQLARIQAQVRAAQAERKILIAEKRSERVKKTRTALALRDRANVRPLTRNARR